MNDNHARKLIEAIMVRRSRRSYSQRPLEADLVRRLQTLLDGFNEQGAIDMRMVVGNSEAWNGVKNSYGMFSGVENYVGLIARPDDTAAFERLGYFGELWVLEATSLGLGTCWVASSFSRGLCPFQLREDEAIICTIAFGYAEEKLSGRERIIKRFVSRKTKDVEEMIDVDGTDIPDWFFDGMVAVQKAPSAVNRQPVVFSYRNGIVTATAPETNEATMGLDFGIAKAHFELGSGGGSWDWGRGSAFHHAED